MRRLKILFFWIFVNKNNISFRDMIYFLTKPTIRTIAKKFIKSFAVNEQTEISFNNFEHKLFWPKFIAGYNKKIRIKIRND